MVHADQWTGDYPYQYRTYKQNDANGTEGKHDYLQLYPALNTMYKGYAFALGYDESHGHTHALDSVKETPRTQKKEQLANCIPCKTPQYTAQVKMRRRYGSVSATNDMIDQFDEPIIAIIATRTTPP